MQNNDYVNAIAHYLRGLQKDSLMNYARLNLSAAYSSVGKNNEALQTLNTAATIDPSNERIYYNRALLYVELGDTSAALDNFNKSLKLGYAGSGLFYNYGMLLYRKNRNKDAEKILMKGYELDPQAVKINYALAFYYMNEHQPQKARKHAEILRSMDGNNPEYSGLFRSLGM
jgi:Flp pilus assembly protein TadD